MIVNTTVLLLSSFAAKVPALNLVLLVVIEPFCPVGSLSVLIVAVNAPPTLFFTKLVIAVSLLTYTVFGSASMVFSALLTVIVMVAFLVTLELLSFACTT